MNISKYMAAQPLNDSEMLLYGTISTSIVVFEDDIYKDIFKNIILFKEGMKMTKSISAS